MYGPQDRGRERDLKWTNSVTGAGERALYSLHVCMSMSMEYYNMLSILGALGIEVERNLQGKKRGPLALARSSSGFPRPHAKAASKPDIKANSQKSWNW